mgnify:CR=1 FL=1
MSRQAYPTSLHDHAGNAIRLPSKPFAVGGEGAVFDVVDRPDLVAKLYSKPQSRERCDKLRAMAKLCNPDLLKIAAWPTATLSANGSAVVDGILMPKVAGFLEIHHLYSVAQRKKDFPEADWSFLLHTARNCAIAFEEIHGHGHVVGDVNQKNVMVSKMGVVAFVDCDSFQVTEGSRIFRCGVGVPEYTPPELHGKNFASLDRSANHDLFGLAILVFHLLMMGRHPFSGVPVAPMDLPIEKAIQDGCYAYARDTSTTRLKPPPDAPPAAMLDSSLLNLFERAFRAGTRPTAAEWRFALDAGMKSLARCKSDPRHTYLSAARGCPWCQLIATTRVIFFVPGQDAAPAFRPEDIERLANRLLRLELRFADYARPKAVLNPVVSLPTNLRAPSQKPVPASVPAPPPMPEKPSLKPKPDAPIDPPRPELESMPPRPEHPETPSLGPPDRFLARLCMVGLGVGFLIIFIAGPVGITLMALFGAWLLLMLAFEEPWREYKMMKRYRLECQRLDGEYAASCEPLEKINKRLNTAWQAEKTALLSEHEAACRAVDDENRARSKTWEMKYAARMQAHLQTCKGIEATNQRLLAAWEAENTVWLKEVGRWREQLAQLEADLNRLEAEVSSQRVESAMRFETMRREAQRTVSKFHTVKQDYTADLQKAEAGSYESQLEDYLDGFRIRDANIKGITWLCIDENLEWAGVKTARDVLILESQKVPGVGPVLSGRLFAWREELVRSFVPTQILPEQVRSRIASRYAPVLIPIGERIQKYVRTLESSINLHHASERRTVATIARTVEKAAAAEAHLKALHGMV